MVYGKVMSVHLLPVPFSTLVSICWSTAVELVGRRKLFVALLAGRFQLDVVLLAGSCKLLYCSGDKATQCGLVVNVYSNQIMIR